MRDGLYRGTPSGLTFPLFQPTETSMTDRNLADWRNRAALFEQEINKAVIGLERPIRLARW